MTERKVVVISQGPSFTVNAVSKALKDSHISVVIVNPLKKEVTDAKHNAYGFVIFLDDFAADNEFMLFMALTLKQTHCKAVLVGDNDRIIQAREYLDIELLSDCLSRPVTVKKIADAALLMVQGDEERNRKIILLVDDDTTFLKMVRSWLSGTYDVVPVTSGAQALQYLALHKPDLILLDYEMPVLNGPQVLESIRSLPNLKDIPVFFLTGVDEKSMVSKAISLKPDGYLLKNFDSTKVLNALNKFFSQKSEK